MHLIQVPYSSILSQNSSLETQRPFELKIKSGSHSMHLLFLEIRQFGNLQLL